MNINDTFQTPGVLRQWLADKKISPEKFRKTYGINIENWLHSYSIPLDVSFPEIRKAFSKPARGAGEPDELSQAVDHDRRLLQMRHNFKGEPLEKVIRDFGNITDKGVLLFRLMRANGKTSGDMGRNCGISSQSMEHYQRGESYYHHRHEFAEALVPPKHRKAFLQAVERTHDIRPIADIFADLKNYTSAHALVADIAKTQEITWATIAQKTGYTIQQESPPNEKKTNGLVKLLRLNKQPAGKNYTKPFTEHMELLRRQYQEGLKQERTPVRNEGLLKKIFLDLENGRYKNESFTDLAFAIHFACDVSYSDIKAHYPSYGDGSKTASRQAISSLENTEHPGHKTVEKWGKALGLNDQYIQMINAFVDYKRQQRHQRAIECPVVSKERRGDFGSLLNVYVQTKEVDMLDLARKSHVGTKTIKNIINGFSSEHSTPQSVIVDKIVRDGLGFTDKPDATAIDQFFAEAGAMQEKPRQRGRR